MLALLLLILAALAFLAFDVVRARSEVSAAKSQLVALDHGIRDGAPLSAQQEQIASFQRNIGAAYDHTHGPLFESVARIPGLGSPLATTRDLTAVARGLGSGSLPQLVSAAATLQPLRSGATNGALPLAPISAAAPTLASAASGLDAARSRIEDVGGSWLGPVSHARSQLASEVATIGHDVDIAATASKIVPAMLGSSTPHTYFVAFLNPAEIRGGGGIIGGFALLHASHGKVTIGKIGGEQDLPRPAVPPAGLDTEWLDNFQPFAAGTDWRNTNLSPDFPSTAAAFSAMYEKDFGTHIDGVLSIDANALATLLRFSGPTTVDGQTISTTNVIDFLEAGEYRLPLTLTQRKDVLGDIGKQVFTRLLHQHLAAQSLLSGLGQDAGAGHLEVFSTNRAEQAQLTRYDVAGALPETLKPFFEATLTDSAGEKLSQYVSEHVTYALDSCSAKTRQVTVTVTLHSDAPTTPLPAYVSTRHDFPAYPVVRNQIRMLLSTFLTTGTGFGSATVDGKAINLLPAGVGTTGDASGFQTATNKGHPTLSVFLEIPPGATRTVKLVLGEPASNERPLLPVQPLPQPVVATFVPGGCVH